MTQIIKRGEVFDKIIAKQRAKVEALVLNLNAILTKTENFPVEVSAEALGMDGPLRREIVEQLNRAGWSVRPVPADSLPIKAYEIF